MKKETIIVSIIALVIGLILGNIFFSNTKIINNTDNSQLEECQNALSFYENTETPRRDSIEVLFDYQGATGLETNGFGDGWIDAQECVDRINSIGNGAYKSCKIESIQILTGSDPNPLKINIETSQVGWQIFDNVGIFKAKCYCSETNEFN
ncbi:hypothetical protein KAT36_00565 [Candidatus Pacearchaeota archaeon]|nr:hypothetical protein [Candidatus Pacearchaeota archaeon]